MPQQQPPATNGPSGRIFGRTVIVGVCALLLSLLDASAAQAVGQPVRAVAQRSPGTTASSTTQSSTPATPTTSDNLLTGTTAPATSTTVAAPEDSPATQVNDDNRRVWLVVAGLILVAVLLALLTLRFWMRTRPAHVAAVNGRLGDGDADADDDDQDDPIDVRAPVGQDSVADPARARDNGFKRPAARLPATTPPVAPAPARSASSLGGLDHDGAEDDWAPRDRRRRERLGPARPDLPARPGRPQREAALRRRTEPPT